MEEKKPTYNVEYAKSYYQKNKEKILKYQKTYYDENNQHRKKRQEKKDFGIKNKIYIIKFN